MRISFDFVALPSNGIIAALFYLFLPYARQPRIDPKSWIATQGAGRHEFLGPNITDRPVDRAKKRVDPK